MLEEKGYDWVREKYPEAARDEEEMEQHSSTGQLTLDGDPGGLMPTVFRSGPYRFHFYGVDGSEPRHVHVERDDAAAKFWLDRFVRCSRNQGFSQAEIRDIERITVVNLQFLRRKWDELFNP